MSLEQYLQFKTPPGMKDELIEGELVILPSGSPNHALLIKKLVRLLEEAIDQNQFEVNADLSIIINRADPASMPRPDVFIMDRPRFLQAAQRDEFPEGSPELAIEVVSPSNTQKELLTKIKFYLRYGSYAVWIVYPKREQLLCGKAKTPAANIVKANTFLYPPTCLRK